MANTLQIGLAVMGGLVLAAVVAHGAWKARKDAPRLADVSPMPEPLRKDPPMDVQAQSDDPRTEPTFDSNLAPLEPAMVQDKHPVLDALIDALAPIELDGPVSGDAALAALPPSRRAGSKPLAIDGLNLETKTWEPVATGRRYHQFQAGVQLANRMGALNEIEYSEFVQKAQAFADAVGGTPQFPEMLDEVARARELDQFASAHDAQLSFMLRARSSAWSPGYVQQNAARLGLVAGVMPGRMVLPAADSGVPPILSLSFDTQAALADDPAQSALRTITLSLDVPQVPRHEQAFVRMRECASALAAGMDGTITDDQGQVISTEAMDVIGADLEQLYNALDARDLSAGSVLARRLFS
jgi:ZipA, C-terminal FtsZ-binding domain